MFLVYAEENILVHILVNLPVSSEVLVVLNYREENTSSTKTSIVHCVQKEIDEYWNLLKNVSGFLLAVNLLPWKGILWAGKFGPGKNAVFGTISSLVGLHLLIKAQHKGK